MVGSAGGGGACSASSRVWSICSTNRNSRSLRSSSGTSSRSFSLRAGRMILRMPARVGREDLLLDAPHRQDLAPQGDLAGHGRLVVHRTLGEERGEGGEHGDPGRGTVLGDRAGGDVEVEVRPLEQVLVDAEPRSVAPDEAQGGVGRLLHDVAELTRELELALALHPGGLDEEDVPPDRGPGQPRGHPGHRLPLGHVVEELDRAQDLDRLLLAGWSGGRSCPSPRPWPPSGRGWRSRA